MPYTPPTRDQLADTICRIGGQLRDGCGNHGCVINPPKGQGTNNSCRCGPRYIIDDLFRLMMEIERYDGQWNLKPSPDVL